MRLIRRRRRQTPAQQVLHYVRLALRGLVAVRVARSTVKGWRLVRKLPFIAALAGAAALVVRRLRSSRPQPAPDTVQTGPEVKP